MHVLTEDVKRDNRCKTKINYNVPALKYET